MSGITDPAQEYFKNGLWAWVTDQWKKLIGDDAGHLQVDIVESGLPSGAATSAKQDTLAGHVDGVEGLLAGGLPSALDTDSLKTTEQSPLAGFATSANQTTMITALQLIDDLRAALNSVATDELDVVIDGQTTDVEIKQTTAADLTPGIKGWDGSAWRKLNLLWGYNSRYVEEVTELNATVNDDILTSTVAAGVVRVITSVTAFNNTTAFSKLQVLPILGATSAPHLTFQLNPVAGTPYTWTGSIVLKAGDYIRAYFDGNTAGDDLYLRVCGYTMKVAE